MILANCVRSRFRAVSQVLCSFIVAAILSASSATADDEGYIDHWKGETRVELHARGPSGQLSTFPIPPNTIPSTIPSLRDFIATKWRGSLAKTCDAIQGRFREVTHISRWVSCKLSPDGELRARLSGINSLDLKYVIKGNQVDFIKAAPDPFGASFDPLVRAEFGIVLKFTIVFEATIDGEQITVSRSARMTKSTVTFASSRFIAVGRTPQGAIGVLFGGQDKLRDAERTMNSASEELSPEFRDLAEMNFVLRNGANELAKLIHSLQPGLGTPTPFFNLSVFINPEHNLVVQYQRFGAPPTALPACSCRSRCNNDVSCSCGGFGMIDERETIYVMRLQPDGSWKLIGHEVGVLDISGSAQGARSGEMLTHKVCRVNKFGSSCTEPISFVYKDIGACPPERPTKPQPGCPAFSGDCLPPGLGKEKPK